MMDGVAGSSFVPDPYDVPIERLDPGDARLFQHGAELGYFARLRREDPVHYTADHQVVMWYLFGNRNEAVFDRANDFWIGRPNARRHLSFGSGIDYCLGARLGELQLRIVWEEVLRRFAQVELAGEPVRYRSNFMRGFERLPVRLTRR